MSTIITKKVRLGREDVRRLRRLARKRGVSESSVLREGIALVERKEGRRSAAEGLIRLIDGPDPRKARIRLR